jgi:hypothetical protein
MSSASLSPLLRDAVATPGRGRPGPRRSPAWERRSLDQTVGSKCGRTCVGPSLVVRPPSGSRGALGFRCVPAGAARAFSSAVSSTTVLRAGSARRRRSCAVPVFASVHVRWCRRCGDPKGVDRHDCRCECCQDLRFRICRRGGGRVAAGSRRRRWPVAVVGSVAGVVGNGGGTCADVRANPWTDGTPPRRRHSQPRAGLWAASGVAEMSECVSSWVQSTASSPTVAVSRLCTGDDDALVLVGHKYHLEARFHVSVAARCFNPEPIIASSVPATEVEHALARRAPAGFAETRGSQQHLVRVRCG